MKKVLVISNICISCDSCKSICPCHAILEVNGVKYIDEWACNLCSACQEICPVNAIREKEMVEEIDS